MIIPLNVLHASESARWLVNCFREVVDTAMTIEVRRPRAAPYTGLRLLQTTAAFAFSSYFFFWLVGSAALWASVATGALSTLAAAGLCVAYWVSIALYKPQYGKGWPFHWFLYSGFVDLCLGYYDGTAIREGEAPSSDGKYLFAMVPHGVFGVCRSFSGGYCWREMYPGIAARWGSFGGAFYIPGVREFSLCCGCLDAGKSALTRAIKRGENVMLLPGGSKELLLTDNTSNVTKLVLRERTGFVRLAIEHGLDLVPGYCFGEKYVHDLVLLPAPIRKLLYSSFRLAGALLVGRWGTFLGKIERNGKPISLGFVWGAPIKVTQQAEPSAEYIAEVHAKYCAEVRRIFDTYKARFGYSAEEELELVSAKSKSQ